MRTHTKLILATLAAAMLLAVGVSGATARSFRVNDRNFEFIWREFNSRETKLELIARTNAVNVQCRVTLLGRFNENTITKETALDQGTINHGELEACEGGTATIQTETMPWGLRYRSFLGTLPRVRSFNRGIVGARFRIAEPNGLTCEAGTEVSRPAVIIIGESGEAAETGLETTGEPNFVTVERGSRIPLRGEFLCGLAGEGEIGGIGLMRNLPRNAFLRFTLI